MSMTRFHCTTPRKPVSRTANPFKKRALHCTMGQVSCGISVPQPHGYVVTASLNKVVARLGRVHRCEDAATRVRVSHSGMRESSQPHPIHERRHGRDWGDICVP